jgi:uncharacterized protein YcbX
MRSKRGSVKELLSRECTMIRIKTLYRHPVKGFSPEILREATLEAEGFFPGDRLFAFENGPSGFDAADPQHQPKIKYLMLMRNEALAALESRFDDATRVLSLAKGGAVVARGHVDEAEGRAVLERFLEAYLGSALRGPVKLLAAPPSYRFMDSRKGFVSLLNLATIEAIGAALGVGHLASPDAASRAKPDATCPETTFDPVRFRGNILLEGMAAFAENALVGKTLRIGEAELEVISRIDRCAATDVNPATAARDTSMVASLERLYGHHDCGIYARIKKAGTIRPGDDLHGVE